MTRRLVLPKLGRVGMFAIAGAVAVGLASCGQGGGNGTDSFKTAFDKSFSETFDKSTHDSCVSSAVAHGAAADAAERYCSCVITELDKLTVEQKQKLQPTSPELQSAADACKPQAQS